MKSKILEIKKIKKIQFKNKRDFCESIITTNSVIYYSTNNKLLNKYILYKYNFNTKSTHKIFRFPPDTIILGSKINLNIFVGCVTSDNSIIVLNLSNKKMKKIKLENLGCPNDICFDNTDNNIVWIVSNRNIPGNNGLLLKININTCSIENINLGFSIEAVSGINIVDDYIYMACLTKVYEINKSNYLINKVIMQDEVNKIFYDNISIYKNTLNIAIFNYSNYIEYLIITNKILLYVSTLLALMILGDVTILNKVNINRKMSTSIIKFAKYDLETKKTTLYSFDKPIEQFDKTVTQINQISSNKYVMVNWKSNNLILVTVK